MLAESCQLSFLHYIGYPGFFKNKIAFRESLHYCSKLILRATFISEYCNNLGWGYRQAIASIPKKTKPPGTSGSQAGHIRIAARILGIDAKPGPS